MSQLYTGSYENCKNSMFRKFDISIDGGAEANFGGLRAPIISQQSALWVNSENMSKKENDILYIEKLYKEVLSKLDPLATYRYISCAENKDIGGVLLDYENSIHRFVIAEWFNLYLDTNVIEVEIEENRIAPSKIQSPSYVKETLSKLITRDLHKNRELRKFKSIRAMYLYEQARNLEMLLSQRKVKDTELAADYYDEAIQLKCESDEIEKDYREKNAISLK